jgi:Helix-turn-helix
MEKRAFHRKHRSTRLTAAEAARDDAIRGQIQVEFPPLEAEPPSAVLSDPLKKAIKRSRKSVRRLAEEANVSAVVLTQFLAGQRDLRLSTAEKLANLLKLKLVSS